MKTALTPEEINQIRDILVFIDMKFNEAPSIDPTLAPVQVAALKGIELLDHPTPLQQLYKRMEQHDWLYFMSDDQRVYDKGFWAQKSIETIAQKIPGGMDLFIAYHKHIFSGEPYNATEQQKPAYPKN